MSTRANKEARARALGPAPMPRRILVGDVVKLDEDKRGPYVRAYGNDMAAKRWTVLFADKIQGRGRLYVEGSPSMIWRNDAALAYQEQSPARREHLTKLGVKLP